MPMHKRALVTAGLMLGVGIFLWGCSGGEEAAPPTGNGEATAPQPEGPPIPPAADTVPLQEMELAEPPVGTDAIDAQRLATARRLVNDGVRQILAQRNAEGGWGFLPDQSDPALTAMALKVLAQHPSFPPGHPTLDRGFEVMLRFRQPEGGIYHQAHGTYTTALAVMAMAAADDPRYAEPMGAAVGYLRGIQIVPGAESAAGDRIPDESHPFVGGVSYGRHGRPDMSNLSFWMSAMEAAGVAGDDPAVQQALLFVTRTQNLSETNRLPWAAAGPNDGGFAYAPARATDLQVGESMAGPGPGGRGLRSYGSMTYAGFKSLLYAGVDRTDPRVQGAYSWIRSYWTLEHNPNMPHAQSLEGLYYYYHIFAKALRAWGEPIITDRTGQEHNWRHELIDALAGRVRSDGSWVNPADRWRESNPVLVTGYAVLALQEALRR